MPLVERCLSLQNRLWSAPNIWNGCLADEAHVWRWIAGHGGLADCCPTLKSKRYAAPPWIIKPPDGEYLQKRGSIALPAVEGVDALVLDYHVECGWDGVITSVSNTITDQSFIEGSGDVTWRLKIGYRFVPDYGAVTLQLGDLRNAVPLEGAYIQFVSLQRVRVYASLGAGALGHLAPGSRINAAVSGWKYPKR